MKVIISEVEDATGIKIPGSDCWTADNDYTLQLQNTAIAQLSLQYSCPYVLVEVAITIIT